MKIKMNPCNRTGREVRKQHQYHRNNMLEVPQFTQRSQTLPLRNSFDVYQRQYWFVYSQNTCNIKAFSYFHINLICFINWEFVCIDK